MKQRILSLFLCAALLISLSACKKEAEVAPKEESANTGFGVSQKSALTQQDLYFFSVTTTKNDVLTALGSPREYLVSDGNTFTYTLQDGSSLKLTYSKRDLVQTATYIDPAGKSQDLFEYLVSIGVLSSYSGNNQQAGNTGVGENTTPVGETVPPEKTEPEQGKSELQLQIEAAAFFSNKRYSYTIANQIVKVGADRETVLSALGKPNSLTSISFKENSYVIDVYVMEDGASLQLDYGYTRTTLRAVRKVVGGIAENYIGVWGEETMPQNFYRYTRNSNLFANLKKGTTPADFYKTYGAPDWYEGTAQNYRDAYQLLDGSVLLLNFGTAHNRLASAVLRRGDGKVSIYPVR